MSPDSPEAGGMALNLRVLSELRVDLTMKMCMVFVWVSTWLGKAHGKLLCFLERENKAQSSAVTASSDGWWLFSSPTSPRSVGLQRLSELLLVIRLHS